MIAKAHGAFMAWLAHSPERFPKMFKPMLEHVQVFIVHNPGALGFTLKYVDDALYTVFASDRIFAGLQIVLQSANFRAQMIGRRSGMIVQKIIDLPRNILNLFA
jgi:hypothetical protein